MKCPHCSKKFEEVFMLDNGTPGALFIVNDDSVGVVAWPALLGLKKYRGCVEFGLGGEDHCIDDHIDSKGSCASVFGFPNEDSCENLYGWTPPDSTAWLVTPGTKAGEYIWDEVTDKIAFSD
jgi:hypothetical protein